MYEQEEVNAKRIDNAIEESESNNDFRWKAFFIISVMVGIIIYAVIH